MERGVTLIDPANTYIDSNVEIGLDTIVLPNTHLQGNTVVGSGSGTSADPDINFPIIPGEATRVINNTEYDLGMSFTSGYAKPEVKKDSGKVIYIDNRRAISRAGDQIEDIKIVVEF